MKIIAYLGGSRGQSVLLSLIDKNLIPEFVYIKQTSEIDIIIEECKLNSIEYELIDRKFSKKHTLDVSSKSPDLLLVSGFNSILPGSLLNVAKYGGINCHAGRLPIYRGAAVIPWQIINGETFGEASVLEMTAGVDDGSILAVQKYSIDPHETSKDIVDKVNNIFSIIVPEVIKDYLRFGNEIRKLNQNESEACTWTQRFPQDGIINWNTMTAREVINLVRALDEPYPGAYTYLCGMKIIIKKAQVHPEYIRGVPGRYIGIRKGKISIIASDRAVAILDFEVSNKSKNEVKLLLKIGANASNEA
jgi:methionyl-tRNA formyltransferase